MLGLTTAFLNYKSSLESATGDFLFLESASIVSECLVYFIDTVVKWQPSPPKQLYFTNNHHIREARPNIYPTDFAQNS